MPRPGPDQSLQLSLLDRMIDDQPRVSSEPPGAHASTVARIKEAVKRDLEWLLNSRRVVADLPAGLPEIGRSLLGYGMPDLTSVCLANPLDQVVLLRAVEETIARFEPRLRGAVVTLDAGKDSDRALRFRIDALLDVDPEPEPVAFDSVLQSSTKAFVVEGA